MCRGARVRERDSAREEAERRSPLPLRATGIVLTLWVTTLVFAAFVIVPLLFATCFPTPG